MNYCLEYIAKSRDFDPIHCYHRLNNISPMPFSVLMKMDQLFLASASPERFLKKVDQKIISQPIKGTIKRSFDGAEDERLKLELLNSEKERSENLMIVDLVRNDLARTALTGTVKVEELFGIYTFKRLHQMISTVVSAVDESTSLTEIIRCAFPMGSMTGAPKLRVMEEIDLLEDTRRGLFSGAVGFFTPEGDFDFNVVIRSIAYDRNLGNISFHVGSAITYDSIPEQEYNECLLKAEAIFEVLKQ
jgi:para-aminobenzoate synthetase component 1